MSYWGILCVLCFPRGACRSCCFGPKAGRVDKSDSGFLVILEWANGIGFGEPLVLLPGHIRI